MTQEDILRAEFDAWVKHDLTRTLVKHLNKLKQDHLQRITNDSTDISVDDRKFRLFAYGAKTIDTVLTIISDHNILVPLTVVPVEEVKSDNKQPKSSVFI